MTVSVKPFFFFFLSCVLFLSGCQGENRAEPHKELLIYCGITMIRPIQEIAAIIEKEQNCIIKITKQGSGALVKSIKANGVGDLFLPGSASYIEAFVKEGLVTDSVTVGRNRVALVVQKGNPLAISPDVHNLTNKKYRVVLGSAESGSIGRETERILSRICIYQQALANTIYLTADSKGIVKALREDNADLVLNWYATTQWEENKPFMEGLLLDEDMASSHEVVLGLLRFSAYPEVARRFMEFAASKEGQAIFARYGFQEQKKS